MRPITLLIILLQNWALQAKFGLAPVWIGLPDVSSKNYNEMYFEKIEYKSL